MGLSRINHIQLRNGRFGDSSADDLRHAFEQFESAPSPQGCVVHFGSGLVSPTSAVSLAEVLLPQYQLAGAFPFCFVWESGPWATIRSNLQDISREAFFRQLLSRLVQYLLPKLGISPSDAESVASTSESGIWLHSPASLVAPFDELPAPRPGLDTTVISETELERMFAQDDALRNGYEELGARVARINDANEVALAEGATGEHGVLLSVSAQTDLFGSSSESGTSNEALGLTWVARTALVAARVGRRVISRFLHNRDHGWYTTTVEELLRELYVDSIGSTVFWNQVKKDTADAFGDDPSQFGGTAFLQHLRELAKTGTNNPPRVTLVGHSAGATFVANFLLAADRILLPNFVFDVVLLAPAVECELFAAAIDTNRIRNIRLFGLSDALEARDALLRPISESLSFVYPRSFLYFVSGLLESEVDIPIVGMQRFYDKQRYPGESFPLLKKVRGFLLHAPDRQVWSPEDHGPGRQCTATHHGAFDQDDPSTLASVLQIVRQGFASAPGGLEITRESLGVSLSDFSEADLNHVVDALPETYRERYRLQAGNVDALLESAHQLPGGYTQLLQSAHRAKPEAQLLQKHLKQGRSLRAQKCDVVLQEAFIAFQSTGDLVLESLSSETHSLAAATQPVLIGLRGAGMSLGDVEGLEIVTQIGRVVAAKATQATLERLNDDDRVISVELSSQNSHVDCDVSMGFIGAIETATQTRLSEQGDQCLIGIIDADIDVLHAAFRAPDSFDATGNVRQRGSTRLVAVWDQRDSTGPAPSGLSSLGGTLHTAAEIDGYIQSQQVGKLLQRSIDGHGTHVASIAAGTPLPESGFPGGVAPKAKLVVVITGGGQFEVGSPASIGYSLSHSAALKFIEDTAMQLDLPVVINLSQGMNSGAHDGSSLVERMFDDFSLGGGRPGRVIVKSAGNDRRNAGHAFVTLNSNSFESLEWESLPLNSMVAGLQRQHDVVELWFDLLNELTFRLVNPSGEKSDRVNWSNPRHIGSFATGNTYSVNYEKMSGETADSRLRVEIRNGSAAAIEAGPQFAPDLRGPWMLEITSGVLITPASIDAWIDRTDRLLVRFTGGHVSEDRTLSVPGTARSVISVGAIHPMTPLQVGQFSAYGTTRDGRKKPEVSAPGINIKAAAGSTDRGVRADSGTSMAAPHVTGAIALVLSGCRKDPNLNVPTAQQVMGAMRAPIWDRGTGYGPLDAKALLQRFNV